jgi:hypothetical protein
MSWNSSRPLSRKTGTFFSRFKPTSGTLLPYVQTTYSCLSRMAAKHNRKSADLPPRKISSFLHPVKDNLGLKTPGTYSIPCQCGHEYIRQTGQTIKTRVKEHHQHILLIQPHKTQGHQNPLSHSKILWLYKPTYQEGN